ncbi:hypothetical protein O1611_g840 [Lasiodiplodia mahajangana]|uniref:Uncharacterized protein n=1 Tax=Lasiodiplodia mahajangana TaxID=1108764 RepID=A0ACC2JZK3_9PEZI|nr:hypothetical protein O1611_g840 [Lasiodiplodia mahajangana]
MSECLNVQKKALAQLSTSNAKIASSTLDSNIDSAVDMSFPASVKNDLAKFEDSESEQETSWCNINNSATNSMPKASHSPAAVANGTGTPSKPAIVLVEGMPFAYSRIVEMGEALAKARRERMFPSTITPNYNIKAVIDDFEDLERLNIAREGAKDPRDDAFRPDVSRMYIAIQRRIQDRDLTHGEVAADSNVRARLSGFANGTSAEAGMYNLMRHAMNSVLRLNNLTLDSDSNIVDAVATRVVKDIRATVQGHAARGAHGVDEVNMDGVMEQVFGAIEDALSQGVGTQATRLDGQYNRVDSQINSMNSISTAQNAQVNAIAGHVNAIDNHVHAMGNNVNAMGTLLTSTNGNVTAMTTQVGLMQSLVNMIPQMASNAVRDMLPEIIGPAVSQAFEGAISNELFSRLQVFANAVQEARAHAEAGNRTREKRGWSWFRIFKKGSGRHGGSMNPTY